MKNPLLDNMKNKVQTIDSAINTLFRLMNGESIQLGGLHKMTVTAPQTNEAQDKNMEVFGKLQEERENLVNRIRRIEPSYCG